MEIGLASVSVSEPTHVAQARRAATACALRLGFGDAAVGRVALAATEAATNLLKHAGGGLVLAGPSANAGGAAFVELLAIDRGPGMADIDACLVDGYSTAGSAGTGLGALRRVGTAFDCYSRVGEGTVLFVRIGSERASRVTLDGLQVGGASVPAPGEHVCGDEWRARVNAAATTVVVSDGLGHGEQAAEASRAAVSSFDAYPDRQPAEIVAFMHEALRATRGAAIAVARIEPVAARVRYCGVGNISAQIVGDGPTRHLVSQNGTAGRDARRIQEFTYDWPARGVLVLHSDGIGSRWRLDAYPGLAVRHPTVIAGVLYRDFGRGRDDATAVVVRGTEDPS